MSTKRTTTTGGGGGGGEGAAEIDPKGSFLTLNSDHWDITINENINNEKKEYIKNLQRFKTFLTIVRLHKLKIESQQ
jgi:hypothetical protein